MVPKTLSDIDSNLLVPAKIWEDQIQYKNIANDLVKKFQNNFNQYDLGDAKVRESGPKQLL